MDLLRRRPRAIHQSTLLATGVDNHESRVSDLDGDGDLDIVIKPYAQDTPRLDIWLNRGGRPSQQGLKPR